MINYDNNYFAWYDCGKSSFSGISLRDKRLYAITGLGCKRSLVQIQSRRPFYISRIIKEFGKSYKSSFQSIIINNHHKSPSLFKETVVRLWYSGKSTALVGFLRNGQDARSGPESYLIRLPSAHSAFNLISKFASELDRLIFNQLRNQSKFSIKNSSRGTHGSRNKHP